MIGNNYLVSIDDVSGQTITEAVPISKVLDWLDNPDESYIEMIEAITKAARIELENRYKITICRRSRELFYSEYANELTLHYGPHASVTSIEKQDFDGTSETLTVNEDYTVYGSMFPIVRFASVGRDIKVTTVSGYANNEVPSDIQTSIKMLVKYIFDGEWDDEEKFPRDIDRIMRYYDKHVI